MFLTQKSYAGHQYQPLSRFLAHVSENYQIPQRSNSSNNPLQHRSNSTEHIVRLTKFNPFKFFIIKNPYLNRIKEK